MKYRIIMSNEELTVIEFEGKTIQLSVGINIDEYLKDNFFKQEVAKEKTLAKSNEKQK